MAQVDKVLDMMSLQACKDTMIGNEVIRGVSGGEKRRVSIAVKLLRTCPIVFLDEPVSGLGMQISSIFLFLSQSLVVFCKTHPLLSVLCGQ